ncbi:transcriptional repressor of the fructose operon, DeoR family [Halarchaeum acidiphilum MH1-52-1]|uniref:Transcriptional repressor of the fructose operon, DeoR family n=2 Tax=Halarchaeum acidiphilum TaxID=489138 RepID=U3AA47_9EURY|nr:HTH-type transcriptional regulator GlpR [Halarchaeum acidiphilum]GAD51638.1 transcriptional repressor of the fructose operon, DeoR family [Halarchaeum acidiphilum MH1-52-1]
MLPEARKRKIVELVSTHDGQSVAELADELDYSKATIRRDLRALAEEGLIERSHGGALPTSSVASERPYGEREVQNLEAKRAIATRAVEELADTEVVFFDAGTTTMEIARRAPSDLLAVTNSPQLAVELEETVDEVKLTGGTLRSRTRALVGPTAESFMERTNFDLLFLGTNGLDVEAGLTTPNENEARMKELMVQKANRVVLVCDATKVGERSFIQFAELGDVDHVITDAALPNRLAETLDAADVRVSEEVTT